MRVLVACEMSGVVRDSFRRLGHDAWSNDLEGVEPMGEHSDFHLYGDCRKFFGDGWDLMIAHPPCTHLAVSGARWFTEKLPEQREALQLVKDILGAPVPKIALENPVSIISSQVRKPTQIIQPWMFGHGECKKTCLWLKGLPKLLPTDVVDGREQRIWKMPPSKDRTMLRSMTYPGIAKAFAEQWGGQCQ